MKIEGTISMHENALNIRLSVFNHNHSDNAQPQNNMEIKHSRQDSMKKLFRCMKSHSKLNYQFLVAVTVMSVNHIATMELSTMIRENMKKLFPGSTYKQQGKREEAIFIFEKPLKSRLLVLDHNHSDITKAWNNISLNYNDQV
ncbi:hypothetical protein TrispH2_011699 [Trichoplax sp. H2]|nr:hypothetical protein TrispH2_011699 [Trichoplax sp. H2]|eukprot:RDD36181.1 hypothetical protein TrispH2_011699 [Trichoplax sp. H2]